MTAWLQGLLRKHIAKGDFKSDDELYMHLIMSVAILYAAFIHAFFIAYYVAVGVLASVAANITGLGVCAGCFLLLRRKRYPVIGVAILTDVICNIFFSICFTGYDTSILLYFLILMAMQVHIPYASARVRVAGFIAAWAGMMGAMALERGMVQLYSIPQPAELVMSFFNVNVCVLGIVLELLLGNFLKETIRAISDKKLEELQSQAYTDALTGLFNRRYFELFTEDVLLRDTRHWCVAILDIDDFKKINDEYGHPAGDKVLTSLTAYLRKCLRKTDVLFRWGGEEFLLFLEGVSLDTAATILEKLRKGAASRRVSTGSAEIRVTVTIGAVPLDQNDIAGSIEKCDKNMYIGKAAGRNKVIL
jgi:diguanylate cyclase (GGDEF)-like protein